MLLLNYWFSSNDVFCADNYIYFRFKLQDKCRSEKWGVVSVRRYVHQGGPCQREVLPRGVPSLRFFTQLGNGSHHL